MIAGLDAKVWNLNPLVATIDGFASPEECDMLIGLAEGRLERARVSTLAVRKAVSEVRTNSDFQLDTAELPQVLPILMKLGMVLRMPIAHAEPLVVLHCQGEEEFKPHYDGYSMDGAPEVIDKLAKKGGQRLFSTMIYLNDVPEGGETAFDALGLSVAPARGRLLIFANCPAGSNDMTNLSRHAGVPVQNGEKWAAITWWHERPFPAVSARGTDRQAFLA